MRDRRSGVFFVAFILILFILTGVLVRVQAKSPDSSPDSNPGFDVSLSPKYILKFKRVINKSCYGIKSAEIHFIVFLYAH